MTRRRATPRSRSAPEDVDRQHEGDDPLVHAPVGRHRGDDDEHAECQHAEHAEAGGDEIGDRRLLTISWNCADVGDAGQIPRCLAASRSLTHRGPNSCAYGQRRRARVAASSRRTARRRPRPAPRQPRHGRPRPAHQCGSAPASRARSSASSIAGHSEIAAASRSLTPAPGQLGSRSRRSSSSPASASNSARRGRPRRSASRRRPPSTGACGSGTITNACGSSGASALHHLAGAGAERPARARAGWDVGAQRGRDQRRPLEPPRAPRAPPAAAPRPRPPTRRPSRPRPGSACRSRSAPRGASQPRRAKAGERPRDQVRAADARADDLVVARRPARRARARRPATPTRAASRARGARPRAVGPTNRHRLTFAGAARQPHERSLAASSRTPPATAARRARRPGWPIATSASRARSRIARPRARRERQRPGERLAAVREGVVDELAQRAARRRRPRRRSPTSTESTCGTGRNTVRATGRSDLRRRTRAERAPTAPRRPRSPAQRRGARRPRAGPSPPSARPWQLVDRAQDHGRGDPVGQVRDHLGRRRVEAPRGRAPARRAMCSVDVGERRQRAAQLAARARGRSRPRGDARPRAASRSDRTPWPPPISSTTSSSRQLGEPLDHVEDVAVDEEVLA